MSDHNTLPDANTDGALTLAQLLATAVEKPIEEDTLSDLQNGPAPTAGRVAEVGGTDYYLGDGSQWVAAGDVSLGSSSEPVGPTSVARLSVTPRDLSALSLGTAEDGLIYRHNGDSGISADGGTSSAPGYYVWSDSDSEFKTLVAY